MIDLEVLRGYLLGLGAPLVLAAGDPALPTELTAFLATVPTRELALEPGPQGIALSGTVLTVSGTASGSWPVQGFAGLSVALSSATVTISNAGGTSTVSCTAAGSLGLAGRSLPVALASSGPTPSSPDAVPGAWRLTLPQAETGPKASELLGLGQGGAALPLPAELVAALDSAVTVAADGLQITFHPGSAIRPWSTVTVQLPGAGWDLLPPVVTLNGIAVQAFLAPGTYGITLTSGLTVGSVPMELGVGVRTGTHWTAFLRPASGGTFPGLADLAQWIGGIGGSGAGSALSAQTGDGFARVGFPTGPFDAAISKIVLGFDWRAPALEYLDIGSVLTLGALQFDVALRLPDIVLQGTLHDGAPVGVPALLTSLGLPADGVPSGLSISAAAFSAQPGLGQYAADLTVDQVWALGPLDLQQLALAVTYDTADGITGSVRGLLAVGDSIRLELQAEYAGPPTGWTFSGATLPGSVLAVGDLIASLAADFGITAVPTVLTSLALSDLAVSYQTGTGNLSFACTGDFTLAGADARLTFGIDVVPASAAPAGDATTVGGKGYAATYSGRFTVGPLAFELALKVAGATTGVDLAAAWQAPAGAPYVGLADLAAALGLTPPALPDGLDLRLTAVRLSYHTGTGRLVLAADSLTYGKAVLAAETAAPAGGGEPVTRFFATLAIGRDIDLTDLPLLAQALGQDDSCAVEDLRVVLGSGALDAAAAAELNAVIAADAPGYPGLPVEGTASPVALSAAVRFGAQSYPVALGTPAAPGGASTAGTTAVGPPSSTAGGAAGAVVPVTPPARSDGTVWFNVQKAIGPITFQRVGARYADGTLWFLLDAALTVGGLSLDLQGASVGSPISSFSPRFDLRGLGVAYSNPPLTIGGGFASVVPTGGASFEYDGAVAVTLPQWGLTAYGSYAELDGEPSMFVFLRATGAFGGPPAFFVTGLAGGFGYNSSVRIPAPDEVIAFPLVGGLADPQLLGGAKATPMQALAALTGGDKPWISPAAGQNWLAAGIDFSSFQLLQSTALLLVEFGNELTIALLGISTARFPNTAARAPYAQIQLQLRALLRPGDGTFSVTANLTRNSYLIDPACVLTGGFAFAVWFDPSPYAGDFTVVLGGYHPSFVPQPYYPSVPALGFSWSLDRTVSIGGSAYFALTPSAIMAGGALAVRYDDGALRAWFTAHADLIMLWSPFHFHVSIGVGIGVDYTVNLLFTTKTLHLEAGADLLLWGPPTGGTATVRLWVVSFTVAFGAGETKNPAPLLWPDFQALLPAPESATTFTATAGLIAQQTDNAALADRQTGSTTGEPAPQPWQVRSEGFACSVRCAVPSSRILLGSAATAPFRTGDAVAIRPMRLSGLAVTQTVTVTRDGQETNLLAGGWTVAATTANVPKALWGQGDGGTLDPGNAQLVPGQLTGVALQSPAAAAGWTAGPADVAGTLGLDPLTPGGVLPVRSDTAPSGDVPLAGEPAVAVIAEQIAGVGAAARDLLFQDLAALGAQPSANGALDFFAEQADTLFADQPLLVGGAA